jgi:hypothetical protein
LYDRGAVGDPTHQLHDWEPGIAPSGLFWTIAIPTSAIEADLTSGQARFHAHNLRVHDFHDFLNAVFHSGAAPVPGRVSFDVRWHGGGHKRKVRDKTFGFEGHYVTGPATISFTASYAHAAVRYKSHHAGQYNPTPEQGGAGHPAVGHERNGNFFR